MEQKGPFILGTLACVILLSFLATPVFCRPSRTNQASSSSDSNYFVGQHDQQQQRYDTHHHYSQRSHHHNHNPHHHSKHGHEHGQSERMERPNHHSHHDEALERSEMGAEVDESNKINLLSHSHQRERYSQRQIPVSSSRSSRRSSSKSNFPTPRRIEEDEYDYENEEEDEDSGPSGRHAYLMTTDKKKSSKEKVTEDDALSQAFEKHMRPSSSISKGNAKEEVHDVYAYQLPSDLWFVVRYHKNPDGQVEKYMNIVDSFTNYLDKLDKDVKTVSVNVKGVETVFRLTTKHNNSSSNS